MDEFDVDASVFDYSTGAPAAVATATPGSMEPIRPQGWNSDDAPIALRIPAEYSPENPEHRKAYELAKQKALSPMTLGTAAFQYIQDVENQASKVSSAEKAVAQSLAEVNRIREKIKSGVTQVTPMGGFGEFIPPPPVPLNDRDRAKLNIQLGTAEEKLKASKAELEKSAAPVSPTFIDVVLPKQQAPTDPQPAAAQQGKIPTRAEAEEGAGVYQLPEITPQEKRFKAFKSSLEQWKAANLANPRVDPTRIKGIYDAQLAQAESSWKEEVRVVGSKLQTRDSPTTPWKEVQDIGASSKELFNKSYSQATDTLRGIEQINQMAILADEAAATKDPKARAAKIAALKISLKAAQSAIVGTSDAIQNAEFKRYAEALERFNHNAILQGEDSVAKFFTTNPEGFAAQMRELRSIVAQRLKPDMQVMQQLRKENKSLPSAPQLPEYLGEMFGQPKTRAQIFEEMKAAPKPNATNSTTSGGSRIQIQR